MKRFLFALALTAATLTAQAALVTTDVLTRGAFEYTPTVAGAVKEGTNHFGGVAIGAMNFSFGSPSVDPVLGDVVPAPSFLAYCIDLYNAAAPKGMGVKYDKIDYANGLNPYDDVAKLITFNGGLSTASASDSAAMQLAIWNLVYDTDLTVSSGIFRVVGKMGGTDVVNKANALLVGGASVETNLWNVSLLTDNDYALTKAGRQDFITASINSGDSCGIGNDCAVPEPGSFALAGLGLLGLAFARRKQA